MAFNIGANFIFFPGLLAIAILTLPLISSENIDCKGKSFHCVNSTHFKICVDLGGGVTRTVDEFLIPCPRSTVCNDINKFECEYQVTTTLSPTQQSDVANVLADLTTTPAVDLTTFAPESDTNISSATTIDLSYEFINNDSYFIPSTTLDDSINQVSLSSANNFKFDKISDIRDEFQVTTNLPSTTQIDIATLAAEIDTSNPSLTKFERSFEFINDSTSNFIKSTTSDDTLNQVYSSRANNFKYNKTSDVRDQNQVTTTLPSAQQSDVVNELAELGTTPADVTIFAAEKDTYISSPTAIGTSYEFVNNDTSNFVSPTSDYVLNQVYSSSAADFKYNKTSDLSDEHLVTTTDPPTQKNDVMNELSNLDTTSAWDNFVVTSFASENDTHNSSATTIAKNYEFIKNDTINFIENNFKYNKTSDIRDQYQIPSTLPSIQQTDVINKLPKVGTTSTWENIEVTSFAPENETSNSSATATTTIYELINIDTSNYIGITSDVTLNQVFFKSASDEYQVTTTLPSTQKNSISDVTNELLELGTTLTWDNVEVTTNAPEIYTYNSTRFADEPINNITSNFIPSTSDDTLNQVNLSSANNINYNKTSDKSDSATVTNTEDDSTGTAKISLNDSILKATLNKSTTLISDESSLPHTIQGTTELNIDILVLNNTNLNGSNNEHGDTNKERQFLHPSNEIVGNPISYSTETTNYISYSNISPTPMSVSNNLNNANDVSISLPILLKPTLTANLNTVDTELLINSKNGEFFTTSITTVASDPTTNLVLNVTDTVSSSDDIKNTIAIPDIRQIYSDIENTLSTKNSFTINIAEQNKSNETENLFTLVSSYTDLSSTKSVESSTVPNKLVDITSLTRNKNDSKNSENIVASSIYATDIVSEIPNQTPDYQLLEMENKYDVIYHLVTPHGEILDTGTIASNESLTKHMESNTPSDTKISGRTEADLKASEVLKTDSIFSTVSDISLMSNLKDMSLTNSPEINVTNDTLYKDPIVDLTTIGYDKSPVNPKITIAENISSVGFNKHNISFAIKDTSTVTTLKAELYNTTVTDSDTSFTFEKNPMINTSSTSLNVNFSSTPTINTPYISNPENFQSTKGADLEIYVTDTTTMEISSSSDSNLDINNRLLTNYPNKSEIIETFDKDNRDFINANLTISSINENRTVSLIDTPNIDPNQEIVTYENENMNDLYSNKNNTSQNIGNGEKTGVFISSPNMTYSQLKIPSRELTISTDTPLNNINNSYVNENEVVVEDVKNNNHFINNNELVQSSVNQTVLKKTLYTTQIKSSLPLSNVNITANNELITGDDVVEANLPLQKQELTTLLTDENKPAHVNTKTSELISTTEAVMIAESTKTYDSAIAEPSSNTNDQKNATNSKLFVNIEHVDSGLKSTPRFTSENKSNIQDLKVSNYETVVISNAIAQSSPYLTKNISPNFENSLSVDANLNLTQTVKNIAHAISSVEMLNKNDNNSLSKSNLITNDKNVTITTKNIEVINNEENIRGMLNNVTLTQNIVKIKSELTGANDLSNTKTLPKFENKPDFNESEIKHNTNENNVNIVAFLGKTNNTSSHFRENEIKINETLKLLQADLNLTTPKHNVQLSNNVKTTPIPMSMTNVGNQATPLLEQFTCEGRDRGKYSDESNCNKFYICIGKFQPIIGMCPEDTVFSEIRKQCTNNLSHCIRNNQFKCLSSGRFVDVLSENFYYICVKKLDGYVRFKLQCQKGYHLDKENIQCSVDKSSIENSSNTTSDKSTTEIKSEDISHSENYETRFECEKEGKFEYPDDCRKYFLCRKSSKSKFRRKIKKCSSDEVFNKEKRKCVDADSYEC